ncbi:polymerase [Campylobacter sp. MIT 12-8780]|uniref:WGR domain-containing protein n=1 Tax=unclassified Campylobacter TaxID=2593542 RepID=UPI00115E8DF5|nr:MULTISPECIES: WGR domain-containing protein [unclassified Campylobacter]NDJ27671.1 WGR domain-containing protein [Campylobacter sp. MIT 19-121]TQR40836.1 polymerase [Campylobacter sp. MIT 12-8780]
MQTTIFRATDKGNTRYYQMSMEQTLFNTFLVERKYGNVNYKSHTGLKIDYFDELEQAQAFYDKMLKNKAKKGYK